MVSQPLRATSHCEFLERPRIPYVVAAARENEARGNGALESVWLERDGPALYWLRAPSEWPQPYRLGDLPYWGTAVPAALLRSYLPARRWEPVSPVADASGRTVAHVLQSEADDIALPFDPDDCIENLLHERYLGPAGQQLRMSRRVYYRIRPFVPRRVQIRLRRSFARRQERTTFPAWPADGTLFELEAFVRASLERVVGARPPVISAWPNGKKWALALTHDVERAPGYDFVPSLVRRELELGFRSALYFVPERDYRVEQSLLTQLHLNGFEVGLHGLRHDGADVEPANLPDRLPAMRRYAKAWGATGFRSPATHRNVATMAALGFDYDSSYSDTARYEPQPGGTCALHPYFLGETVELPITLPMDHTLFEILRDVDASRWIAKAEWLRERGGMALMLTHPDYLIGSTAMRAYEEFLAWAAEDPTCWRALPTEVSTWWRSRAATELVREHGAWIARGPAAADATVA